MPGITGIVARPPTERLAGTLRDMLGSMQHEPWYRVEQACHSGEHLEVGLGRVTLGFVNTAPQPAASSDGQWLAVLDGELYDTARLSLELSEGLGQLHYESHAALLATGYEKEGSSFLTRVRGKYTAALWNAADECLVLITDPFGMKPLYYSRQPGQFVFGSEIKSLLVAVPHLADSPNPHGIIQFFTYGQLWNQDTFYANVQTVPSGTVLKYYVREDRLEFDRYWHLEPNKQLVGADRATLLEAIYEAFQRAVDSQSLATDHLGLALSGGLDARTILGCLDRKQVELQCVCLGMEGSLDQRSARALADAVGYPFHSYVLGQGFLSRFREHLERMVRLTDGHYLSQCIVMPTFPLYRQLGIEVLLRGHAGELMHMSKAYSFSLDAAALRLSDAAALEEWLLQHLQAYMLGAVTGPLFAFADELTAAEMARETLRRALAETAHWQSPVNRIAQLFVTQRLRRETATALVKFNSVVETRLPFIDRELIEAILAAPVELRWHDEIQVELLRRSRPDFLSIANSNTGAAVGAGWLKTKWHRNKMRVLAKLGVRGYQPYERLGLWLRQDLRDTVRDILLDEQCLERGIFRADTVRQVVDEHLENRRNHTFLLMALMIFELGQRLGSDKRGAPQRGKVPASVPP